MKIIPNGPWDTWSHPCEFLAIDIMVDKTNIDTHTTWRFLGFEIEVTYLYSSQ